MASHASARVAAWGWAEDFRKREHQISIVLSLLIGALVGLVVVAFMLLTGRLAARMYPAESAAWRRVLIPTFGALISGWLLLRYFPQARGSGIPQTKFAIFIYDGYISLRTVLGKLLCCSMSLASGIALGREGPSVQIGGGIASALARRFSLSNEQVKSLIPAGCSAALAAAFNTPIAAVLFSLEEILGDLHAPVLGSVVISSATSWMVLHLILGDEPLFHVPAYHLVNPAEFGIYAILGVVGGLGSVCFVKLLLGLRQRFRLLPRSTQWWQPMVGGLVVGLLGWWKPAVLGVGYEYVERALSGDFIPREVALLAILKIIATASAYSSGNAGGIFGPSLFIGAMIGAAVGGVAHHLLPNMTADPGAYVLIGMGTAFAGIIRTPLTSVIMIFELTRDYAIIVPLMISNLVSFIISRAMQPAPIYEALAAQEGVELPTVESRAEAVGEPVSALMQTGWDPLPITGSVAEARHRLEHHGVNAWPVASGPELQGLITRNQLDSAHDAEHVTLAAVLDGHLDREYPYIHPDQTAGFALQKMGTSGLEVLPVVSRANRCQYLGMVTLSALLESYGVARFHSPKG